MDDDIPVYNVYVFLTYKSSNPVSFLLSFRLCLSSPSHKVDRKASKGRKIRYTRHPKIENFMFPVSLASLSTGLHGSHDSSVGNIGEFGTDQNRFYQSLFQ